MSSTNRGATRNEHDLYPTPDTAIEPFLEFLDLSQVTSFCEPCKADGQIMKYFTNIDRLEYAEIRDGIDYLKTDFEVDLIVTNPPFSLALEFLEKSLSEAKTVAYLLRLNFLGSQKRKKFWQENPPTHIFILSKRPSFTGKGTDSTEYAWFVWDRMGIIKTNNPINVI